MQKIDSRALIQRIQEARAHLGMTIRECAEKIGQPPYSTKITPHDWELFERGTQPPSPELVAQAAALLGIEIPMIEADEAGPKRYRCAVLTADERAELDRMMRDMRGFCRAKGVGMSLMLTFNMTRTEVQGGHHEECVSVHTTANLHALSYAAGPAVSLLQAAAPKALPLKGWEAAAAQSAFSQRFEQQIRTALEQAPAGEPILEGFDEKGPRFKT